MPLRPGNLLNFPRHTQHYLARKRFYRVLIFNIDAARQHILRTLRAMARKKMHAIAKQAIDIVGADFPDRIQQMAVITRRIVTHSTEKVARAIAAQNGSVLIQAAPFRMEKRVLVHQPHIDIRGDANAARMAFTRTSPSISPFMPG